ncbi:hypothetical protein V6N11_012222 [Hibiscus sabdariffa]|uniref:Uncharacterized protein n=1 Tax=Hibiscus sabdariffa TaxID=183260 RepID=A0ABR2QAH7_9ROSI
MLLNKNQFSKSNQVGYVDDEDSMGSDLSKSEICSVTFTKEQYEGLMSMLQARNKSLQSPQCTAADNMLPSVNALSIVNDLSSAFDSKPVGDTGISNCS